MSGHPNIIDSCKEPGLLLPLWRNRCIALINGAGPVGFLIDSATRYQ